jgi:uroporphyrinogen decarboxylase
MDFQFRQPDFTRLKKTLFNEKADTVPLIELGIDPYIKSVILKRSYQTLADEVEFMSGMGYDFVKLQPKINIDVQLRITQKQEKYILSSIDNARAWAPDSKGIIKNWNDFEKYPWPVKSEIDYSAFEKIRNLLPDGMGVIGQYGDIFTLTWEMMGFENFAIAIYQQPDLVEAIFDKIGDLIISMFDTMADMEWVEALWYSDDIAYTSGLMVNPQFFRSYFFPLLKYIGDLAKKRKIPFIFHSDGILWDVMEDIIDSGINALHPIEPKSMDLREVKKKVGDKLCLCGGIDVDMLARSQEDEIVEITQKWLTEIAETGGYCAGSSNSIPEYINIKNYLAMVQTVINY